MGLKGLRMSVEDTPTMTLDRTTIVKSRVMGLCGHVVGARVGRHLELDGSVTESVLRPEGLE
jgi:hypothetical protein